MSEVQPAPDPQRDGQNSAADEYRKLGLDAQAPAADAAAIRRQFRYGEAGAAAAPEAAPVTNVIPITEAPSYGAPTVVLPGDHEAKIIEFPAAPAAHPIEPAPAGPLPPADADYSWPMPFNVETATIPVARPLASPPELSLENEYIANVRTDPYPTSEPEPTGRKPGRLEWLRSKLSSLWRNEQPPFSFEATVPTPSNTLPMATSEGHDRFVGQLHDLRRRRAWDTSAAQPGMLDHKTIRDYRRQRQRQNADVALEDQLKDYSKWLDRPGAGSSYNRAIPGAAETAPTVPTEKTLITGGVAPTQQLEAAADIPTTEPAAKRYKHTRVVRSASAPTAPVPARPSFPSLGPYAPGGSKRPGDGRPPSARPANRAEAGSTNLIPPPNNQPPGSTS